MKPLIQAIKTLLIILLIAVLFLWLLYHGSGHNVPADTDNGFIMLIGILIVLYMALFILKRKYFG